VDGRCETSFGVGCCTGVLHLGVALGCCTGVLHWGVALGCCTGVLHWGVGVPKGLKVCPRAKVQRLCYPHRETKSLVYLDNNLAEASL
jgi:hypothetical protein